MVRGRQVEMQRVGQRDAHGGLAGGQKRNGGGVAALKPVRGHREFGRFPEDGAPMEIAADEGMVLPKAFGQAVGKVIRSVARVHSHSTATGILAIEGALPIFSEGPQPDVLSRLVVQLVPVVAPAALGGADTGPARGAVDGAGVARGFDEGLDESSRRSRYRHSGRLA